MGGIKVRLQATCEGETCSNVEEYWGCVEGGSFPFFGPCPTEPKGWAVNKLSLRLLCPRCIEGVSYEKPHVVGEEPDCPNCGTNKHFVDEVYQRQPVRVCKNCGLIAGTGGEGR